MQQQTIPVSPNLNVLVHAVHGDLRVAGWDRNELMVKTDGSHLDLVSSADPLTISCDEDVILYLPRTARLQVENVAGDASLQALSGPVTLGPVAGDLTMKDLGPVTLGTVSGDASLRNIGALNAENISGDFALRGGHGVCAVDVIGGDASIRDIDGMLAIEQVGSDLYVRNVRGAVNVNAGADVALYLEPLPGQTYDITAGDDLILRLSPEANVKLHLTGGSPDSIHVDFPGVEVPEDCSGCDVVIGTGNRRYGRNAPDRRRRSAGHQPGRFLGIRRRFRRGHGRWKRIGTSRPSNCRTIFQSASTTVSRPPWNVPSPTWKPPTAGPNLPVTGPPSRSKPPCAGPKPRRVPPKYAPAAARPTSTSAAGTGMSLRMARSRPPPPSPMMNA